MAARKNLSSMIVETADGSLVYKPRNITVRVSNDPSYSFRVARYPFLEGWGSIINISGRHDAFGRFSRGDASTDMRHDWEMVGVSIRKAMDNLK